MLGHVIYFLCILCCVIYQLCTYIRYGRKMFWSVAWCGEDFRWHLSLALQNHYKHTQWHRKWCREWIYTVGGCRHNTAGTQYYVCDSNPGHVVGIIHCESDSLFTIIRTCMHSSVYVCMQVEWRESQVCLSSKFEGKLEFATTTVRQQPTLFKHTIHNHLRTLMQLTVLRETAMQMKIFDSSPKQKQPMKKSPKLFTNSGFCSD